MSDSSRKETIVPKKLTGLSELRLIMHGYATHTTVALITRERNGVENWDRREHAWDLPLPQRDYEFLRIEEQLWVILGKLAETPKVRRAGARALTPASPVGDDRGQQYTQPTLF